MCRIVSKFLCRLAAKRVFSPIFSAAEIREISVNQLFLLNFLGRRWVEIKNSLSGSGMKVPMNPD
jgi:hypothetical protein